MTKKVFDIGIEVKRATMHVLANSPEEAFEIAKNNLDDWYNEHYDESMVYDCPEIVDCSENIYVDDEEDEPLYGSEKYKTLGEYMDADDEDADDGEEFVDPNQTAMDFGEGGEQ